MPEGPRAPRLPLVALTILAHPDLERIGERALLGEIDAGRPALLGRRQPSFSQPEGAVVGQPLANRFLSRVPVRLLPILGGGLAIDPAGSRTELLVAGEPVTARRVFTAGEVDEGIVLTLARRVVLLLHRLPPPPEDFPPRFGLVGDSPGLLEVRDRITQVAAFDVPVLLRGETGTGKELVARALHEESRRRGRPFVSVNLGALPPSLATAELFGSRKGAFTGAVRDQAGFFGRAQGGTLLLDEIGEATPEVQVMLLRTLETGEVAPVGSQMPRPVDVRIVSATDADLEREIETGGFRAPLFHRLAGYTIYLPPLRRRKDDLGRLLVHFLRRECERLGGPFRFDPDAPEPWLPAELVTRFLLYEWPGNVRQLANVARQLVIESRGGPIRSDSSQLDGLLSVRRPAAAPESLLTEPPSPYGTAIPDAASRETPVPPQGRASRRRKPSEISEEELLAALEAHRWELKATARALGIARTSLYDRMKRSPRIRSAADVPEEEIRQAHRRHGGDLPALVADLKVSERALRQRLKDLGLR